MRKARKSEEVLVCHGFALPIIKLLKAISLGDQRLKERGEGGSSRKMLVMRGRDDNILLYPSLPY